MECPRFRRGQLASSRLDRVLVHEKQIAKSVSAAQVSRRLTSMYMIQATAAEGHTTDEIVAEIDAILREVAAEAPTAEEVEIGRITWEARFVRDLQSLHSRANKLNSYFVLTGQPDSIEMDLGRYGAVTPEAIQQAAAALAEANRVTLHIHPEEK